ncbi:lysine--tRNA ligase [bacterium]|nr:MAG: lysine--tRNA ligase [bacterium]
MSDNILKEIDPRNQRAVRIAKMEKLRAEGIDPYPPRPGEGRVSIASVRRDWDKLKQQVDNEHKIVKSGGIVRLAGRITAIRTHGKSVFFTIADGTGTFQLYIRKNSVEENMPDDPAAFERVKELDIGDFITSEGELFTTRTGEATQLVHKWAIICKTLLPLPEKYHGLTDPDLRLRQRYLDLMANPDVKSNFLKRALIIRTIREYLQNEGYVELETPVLTPLYGGATARPFKTHHNTLNIDLYMRIATELYLKRLIVGGFERVFEMGKVFRNEGVDRDHNPEFTLLELYEAYADYNRMMELAEGIVIASARAVGRFVEEETESPHIVDSGDKGILLDFEGDRISIIPPFRRIAFIDAIKDASGIDITTSDRADLISFFEREDIEYDTEAPYWPLVDKLFSETVEPKLIEPTFVVDYPVALSPLAKRKPDNPDLTERFELFILEREIANAFTELNDPIDQRKRMENQIEQRKRGDKGAPDIIDEDFLTALEHGMPPTGGMGIGIGRLVTILCGVHALKDVIPFPLLKPLESGK